MIAKKRQNGSQKNARRLVALIYPGMVALDLVGPVEAFRYASLLSGSAEYRIEFVSEKDDPVSAASTLKLLADQTIGNVQSPSDILLIPGMMDPEDTAYQSTELLQWVKRQCKISNRWVSICSGVFVLAAAGVLGNEEVTTHWNDSAQLRKRFPALTVQDDQIYVKSGKLYTSGGVTAGIDLALAIIAEDHGKDLALAVAKRMLVYLQRSGDQRQFSSLLKAQSKSDRFRDLITWIDENLQNQIDIETLSNRCAMSPRNFSRAFRTDVGLPPMTFVRERRLEKAKMLLEAHTTTIGEVAKMCGFNSLDQFGKSFGATFAVSPQTYRKQFYSKA